MCSWLNLRVNFRQMETKNLRILILRWVGQHWSRSLQLDQILEFDEDWHTAVEAMLTFAQVVQFFFPDPFRKPI